MRFNSECYWLLCFFGYRFPSYPSFSLSHREVSLQMDKFMTCSIRNVLLIPSGTRYVSIKPVLLRHIIAIPVLRTKRSQTASSVQYLQWTDTRLASSLKAELIEVKGGWRLFEGLRICILGGGIYGLYEAEVSGTGWQFGD